MPPVNESILHALSGSFVFAVSESQLFSVVVTLSVPQRFTFAFAVSQPELQPNLRPFICTDCCSFERPVNEPELRTIHVSHRSTQQYTDSKPQQCTISDPDS